MMALIPYFNTPCALTWGELAVIMAFIAICKGVNLSALAARLINALKTKWMSK